MHPGGTAAITDAGMTGPHDSVIGVKAELAIRRMRTGMRVRFEPAEGGVRIEGALVECDADGRAYGCEAVRVPVAVSTSSERQGDEHTRSRASTHSRKGTRSKRSARSQ